MTASTIAARSMLSALALGACVVAQCGQITSFGDIEYWVGEGPNHAAIAIDWDGDNLTPIAPALVWGVRWSGVATGEELLRGLLAAEPRLFAKLSAGGPYGTAVYGLGYDANNDGDFALEDNTPFDPQGVAIGQPIDGLLAVDPADHYQEGWLFGYWHYAHASGPGDWTSSSVGPSTRTVNHGDWESYAFSPMLSTSSFADQLTAAAPPPLPGDFNQDGSVDAADYTFWRDTQGDEAAFALWSAHYGQSTRASATPEPSALAMMVLFLVWGGRLDRGLARHPFSL